MEHFGNESKTNSFKLYHLDQRWTNIVLMGDLDMRLKNHHCVVGAAHPLHCELREKNN